MYKKKVIFYFYLKKKREIGDVVMWFKQFGCEERLFSCYKSIENKCKKHELFSEADVKISELLGI